MLFVHNARASKDAFNSVLTGALHRRPALKKGLNMKKVLLAIGLVLLASAGIWKFAVAPRYDVRFPDNWKWTVTTFGTNLYADDSGQFPASKTFPGDDDVSTSDRTITVSRDNAAPGTIRLDDHYLAKDPNTGAVTWDFTYQAVVDPTTGKYISDEFKNDYFLFPRNAQKQTYNVRNTSYPGLPVAFQKETTIEGLSTYEFAYTGDYDNAAAYPDTKLEAGQSIKCSNIDLRYWVEPLTGEVVKYTEACNADAVLDSSGNVVKYLSRWSGESQSNNILVRVGEIANMRNSYLMLTRFLHLFLLVVGVLLLVGGVVPFGAKPATAMS
jgi:hypothetical protein